MKRVFLICPEFYDYKAKIEKEILEQGYDLYSISERPRRWVYSLIKRCLSNKLAVKLYDWYFWKYKDLRSIQFDIFICVRGEVVPSSVIRKLRNKNPSARFVMYQWDSEKVVKYLDKRDLFDDLYSFDTADCESYGVAYLPLFYTNEFCLGDNKDYIFDVSYVGSYNEERYLTLEKIRRKASEAGVKFDCYLYIAFIDYLKLFLFSSVKPKLSSVKFKKISKSDVVKRIQSSRAVLDIENIKQSGFTMRTFEVLATGRMLITTNKNAVLLKEFSRQVRVVKRANFAFPKELSVFSPRVEPAMGNYSISSWVKSILVETQ